MLGKILYAARHQILSCHSGWKIHSRVRTHAQGVQAQVSAEEPSVSLFSNLAARIAASCLARLASKVIKKTLLKDPIRSHEIEN